MARYNRQPKRVIDFLKNAPAKDLAFYSELAAGQQGPPEGQGEPELEEAADTHLE